MTPNQKLELFLAKHRVFINEDSDPVYNIPPEQEHIYDQLVADTLPSNQQKTYLIESEFTRVNDIINNTSFNSDFDKNEVGSTAYSNKINEYLIDLLLDYIQDNLNLSGAHTNKLYKNLLTKAINKAKAGDQAFINAQARINQHIADQEFEQKYGFTPCSKTIYDK